MIDNVEYYWSAIIHQLNASTKQAIIIHTLLEEFVTEVTDKAQLDFATFFTRLSYLFHQYNISKKTQIYLFEFRKSVKQQKQDEENYIVGVAGLAYLIKEVLNKPIPKEILQYTLGIPEFKRDKTISKIAELRVVITESKATENQLRGYSEDLPGQELIIKYREERNELFTTSFDLLGAQVKLPCIVQLIDIEISEAKLLIPKLLIIQPDFLIDVTAVSDVSADPENKLYSLLTKKLLPAESSMKLLEGHAANFFLDKLINDTSISFDALFGNLFQMYPLIIANYTNEQVKDLNANCKHHYSSLQWIITHEFPKLGIRKEGIYLEPSFYSSKYGLQGRLDLFYKGANKKSAIVELKSGKPFKANKYGLSSSHYIQTLLYDLLVKTAFKGQIDPTCFILYSKLGEQGLKYAAPVTTLQYVALNERNHIIAFEATLQNRLALQSMIESSIVADINIKGFLRDNWQYFKLVYKQLDEIEKEYFLSFIAFIAREHLQAKTGTEGNDTQMGQASLWLDTIQYKEENFSIYKDLSISEINITADEPLLELLKTASTNELANFRVGDIVILYPNIESNSSIETQIFKSTIVELSNDIIKIRLRSTQLNTAAFFDNSRWNLEHDLLDSSFLGHYRSLFGFAKAESHKRKLILGRKAPAFDNIIVPAPEYLTQHQKTVFSKAIQAKDYFLVWGPPGTGKTSQMLCAFAGYYYHLRKPILLVTFTNKAADEVCEAIERIDKNIRDHYFRIGSRYSTNTEYSAQLLDFKIAKFTKRKELLHFLNHQRIVVSTLASLSGKPEIFDLINFEVVIIDEASQVLEPMMAGLVGRIKKSILIGDHNQLASIVTQNKSSHKIESALLNSLGINDMAISLFERLFNQCLKNGWHEAYGMLTQQGRMHEDIMAFPNQQFYNGSLESIYDQSKNIDLAMLIKDDLGLNLPIEFSRRVVFINSVISNEEQTLKTNIFEANEVVRLVEYIKSLSELQAKPFTIGIITPFRSQIALIRKNLEAKHLLDSTISIDTVERYQGSARDIIIISLCANRKQLLNTISSKTEGGTDRKLNVALTRARHHLIVIGNKEVLSQDNNYKQFIERYEI